MIKTALSLPRAWWANRRSANPNGFRGKPRFLTYLVTFSCNARCRMCDSWQKASDDDLTLEDIERIFAQLPRLDAVRLSGGEPFLRRDLGEIARLASAYLKPAVFHITSNGLLTRRIVDFCQHRDKDTTLHLLISLDAVGSRHDEIRGVEKAWERAMATIRDLAPRQKELALRLSVNQTVVDEYGLDHYRDLRRILQPLGVNVQTVLAYQQSATYSTASELVVPPDQPGDFTPFVQMTQERLIELLRELEHDTSTLPITNQIAKRYYLRGLSNRLVHQRAFPNPPCVALHSHLRLYPDGRVPTCQFNSTTVGNLRTTPFGEVWRGRAAVEQRCWVRNCPGCWAECEVLPNAIYSGDLFGVALGGLIKRDPF
jgi:MoaA/NifB/PqqE/SkfB family radical SAM enzyme